MIDRSRVIRQFLGAARLLLLITATACSSPVQPSSATLPTTSAPTASAFTDPFAYCAAVGTVDTPGPHYTGTPVPDSVINGFKQAAGLTSSTETLDQLRQSTIWRCMDGKVYACNFGADLPCDSKADTNSTPSPYVEGYCKVKPNSDFIPKSVTGHATVYSWRCINGTAQAGSPVSPIDGRGFLQSIWYPIQPSP
jgi:hypothetical protein